MGKTIKKRKLKKWVKKTLIVIPIITILLVITISIKNMKPTFASSKTTSKIEKEPKATKKNNNKEELPKGELERFTYQENFYYENISNEVKKKITGKSYPLEFDEHYTQISYSDLKYVKVKYITFKLLI